MEYVFWFLLAVPGIDLCSYLGTRYPDNTLTRIHHPRSLLSLLTWQYPTSLPEFGYPLISSLQTPPGRYLYGCKTLAETKYNWKFTTLIVLSFTDFCEINSYAGRTKPSTGKCSYSNIVIHILIPYRTVFPILH